ncbi:16S rRNA (guanine(527)-N(7))-methyltransferase RsmG [Dongia sedimenti]|uniref:Ribosomal RNA small subunit methyltransferase G n=1 Tax=Dongia sedimenti TaxID=3064282 RepID=A0ABU0YMW0_9PROT|nr:16S rRNA (guanine(527)-N(7))-methyltransferase RsmG [Rhodospirillaceae bacterium R-7]
MGPEQFRSELQSLGVDVSRETMTALETYAGLLRKWQKAINLVSGATLDDVWQRHFLDSAQLVPLLPEGAGQIVDLGSGAGFPGLILALLSGRPTHLIESDQRKAAFLGEVARATGCAGRVQVHAARVEALKPWAAPVITARALADLGQLLDWAAPFVTAETVCLFPKGAKAEEELTGALRVWKMTVERRRSVTDPTGLILRLSHLERRGQT